MQMWKPQEIIIHEKVRQDPVTLSIVKQCPGIPIISVNTGIPHHIVQRSEILSKAGSRMLDKILAGKKVLYIAPAKKVVDVFEMPDDRMVCPHFDRLKLASNGCFYQCDWCYLKLTYRTVFPFITIRVQYDKIKKQLSKKISRTTDPVIFNSGELADSLSMEHLTGAAKEFIPWFGQNERAYLFMLTKSDTVEGILDLPHNNHTIVAWSIKNEWISKQFEIGAPPFEMRLEAACTVQSAGYPVRIRLDPIVPFPGWKEAYAKTIQKIFSRISPERVTIGTLRFEGGFYAMRNTFFTTGPFLPHCLEKMVPMFAPKKFPGLKKPKSGKYSFPESERVHIFSFIIKEIRKHSDCRIALCKESASVWNNVNLPLSKCSCVCQLDYADMEF